MNHNGISESLELATLQTRGLKTLELAYKTSKFVNQYGNSFRYRAKLKDTNEAQAGRKALYIDGIPALKEDLSAYLSFRRFAQYMQPARTYC